MNEKAIVREVMALRKWTQADLARESGFRSQSNITGLLNNNKNGIRIDNLVRILSAMGCEVIVRDKMGSGKEWKVEFDD